MKSDNQSHPINPHAMYRAPECARLFSVGTSSWWAWSHQKKIKSGIKLGPRTTVWPGEYLLQLRAQFIAEAQGQEA